MWVLLALGCRHRVPPPPPAEEVSDAARAWYLTARVATERGDLETAERAWTWVVRLDPDRLAGWSGLVDLWLVRLADPAGGSEGVTGLLESMNASCRFATVDRWFAAHPERAAEARWGALAAEARRRLHAPNDDRCHPDARRAQAEARGCAGWLALWEVAPTDAALAGRRAACPELPSGGEAE